MESLPVIRELKLGGKEDMTQQLVLQQIIKLERRIFPKHESLSSSLQQEASKKNSGILYAVAAPNQKQPDLKEDGPCVAGYVMYSFTTSLSASINKLAVRESCRKQGYGEALLRAAIAKCQMRSISRVTLHVDPMREPAMCLYKKLCFKLDTIVLDYYAPDRDAHRMFIEFNTSS